MNVSVRNALCLLVIEIPCAVCLWHNWELLACDVSGCDVSGCDVMVNLLATKLGDKLSTRQKRLERLIYRVSDPFGVQGTANRSI